MVRMRDFRSFCLVALLVVQATQAITPDIASLASTRLLQIVAVVVERGESQANLCLYAGCITLHNEQIAPPKGPVPFEDRSEESAPDEVCLASYETACQLTAYQGDNSAESQPVRFDLALLSLHSDRIGSSYVSQPLSCNSVRIHSLCRMTC